MNSINAIFVIFTLIAIAIIALVVCAIFLNRKIIKIVLVSLSVALLCGLIGCVVVSLWQDPFGEREYFPEIAIPIEDTDGEFVIKEWEYLSKCGVEFYYRKDGKTILLDQCIASVDDGLCPFSEGLYTVKFENGTVIVKWCENKRFRKDELNWTSQAFDLPT